MFSQSLLHYSSVYILSIGFAMGYDIPLSPLSFHHEKIICKETYSLTSTLAASVKMLRNIPPSRKPTAGPKMDNE